MEFNYRFFGNSNVSNSGKETNISFAPDTLREPAYFVANLGSHIPFREAISALHHVVVSDLRFKPRDRTEYMRWLKEQESSLLAEFLLQGRGIGSQIETMRTELTQLNRQLNATNKPFYEARQKYFNYLYRTDYDAWFVLDPVITVHPDEVFFECFSQDESTYGRLSCDHGVFKDVQELAYGTTNIDYSTALYNEFQKIRTYKNTQFRIEPGGFAVETSHEEQFVEEKIDLPDSWVRGFLQVSSAMTLPSTRVELHPMDIHYICHMLRRLKEKTGPRSLRFILKPDKPVEVIFEPWNNRHVCARSIFMGMKESEVRIWGRRRLLILERLIPITKNFIVYFLGSGLPSFYVADLGEMRFTLGLSGWTANDWSRMGNFDLMAPRAQVDEFTKLRVFKELKKNWFESVDSLAARMNTDRDIVLSSLAAYTQAGRAIFDISKHVYRVRELSREPLPMDKLRFQNEREEKATNFIDAGLVKLKSSEAADKGIRLTGTVRDEGKTYNPSLVIDFDQRMVEAECSCYFYGHNKLFKGPCEHMLALRIQHRREQEKH